MSKMILRGEEARKALYVAHQKSPEAWVYKKK